MEKLKHHLAPWLICIGLCAAILAVSSWNMAVIVIGGVVGCGMVAGGMWMEGWI